MKKLIDHYTAHIYGTSGSFRQRIISAFSDLIEWPVSFSYDMTEQSWMQDFRKCILFWIKNRGKK